MPADDSVERTKLRQIRQNLRKVAIQLMAIALGSVVLGVIAGLLTGSTLFGLVAILASTGLGFGVYFFGTEP